MKRDVPTFPVPLELEGTRWNSKEMNKYMMTDKTALIHMLYCRLELQTRPKVKIGPDTLMINRATKL